MTGQKESGKAPTTLCCENKEEVGGGEKGLNKQRQNLGRMVDKAGV